MLRRERAAPIVRERVERDLRGAADALVDVHGTDGYPVEGVADPLAWLTDPHLLRAWVVELEGRIVGHVAVSEPQSGDAAAAMWPGVGEVVVLGRLFVVASARGRGLGEQLVDHATAYGRERGQRLVLDVMTKDDAAIALYRRLGWQRLGATTHDTGAGEVVPAECYLGPR